MRDSLDGSQSLGCLVQRYRMICLHWRTHLICLNRLPHLIRLNRRIRHVLHWCNDLQCLNGLENLCPNRTGNVDDLYGLHQSVDYLNRRVRLGVYLRSNR